MLEHLEIQSHKGVYRVDFVSDALLRIAQLDPDTTQLIVDAKVLDLYRTDFESYLGNFKKILIKADESNKNIDRISDYVSSLMSNGARLDHTLVAIGGGIIQDITCFLASTLFRGMTWSFVPTTLLAQADSCIGSKSSINVGEFKNLMGTFTPPKTIYLDTAFLKSLSREDISSGLGEILKVHMIKGEAHFEKAAAALEAMAKDAAVLLEFIQTSLLYKKEMIERDEFDRGPRNVMNYGHSFGHAIESATNFAVPHGIAVTIGMDMANHQSFKMGRISREKFLGWHRSLFSNYQAFAQTHIDIDAFLAAIKKDKKNQGLDLSLILVRESGPIEKVKLPADSNFRANCQDFFATYMGGAAS